MDEGRELSDLSNKVRRLERKKPKTDVVPQPEQTRTVWLDADFQIVSGTATADVAQTKLALSEAGVPREAKRLHLWAGTTDACDGTGLNYLYYHSGGKRFILCEQRGTSTSDTQNNMNYMVVPYFGGANYSIDLNGATSFPWRIAIRGYEI